MVHFTAAVYTWDGHTVHDAKARGERRIQNAGDSVWLSLFGEENHYYWFYYYDYRESLIPNPKMQFYNSDGTEVVLNRYTVEDELGSGERRFNLPSLRFMPDATDTYYMKVSSTSNGTGKFWVYFGDSSITSSRGDRNSSNCHSGRTHANCKIHAAGTHIEGLIDWSDVDTYKVTYRKGDVIRACANFVDDAEIGSSAEEYAIYDNHNWLFTTEAGQHCTDYFTVDRTGAYIINVMHMAPVPKDRSKPAEYRRQPGHNYTVWYERQ